jgi:hypothetical protein
LMCRVGVTGEQEFFPFAINVPASPVESLGIWS